MGKEDKKKAAVKGSLLVMIEKCSMEKNGGERDEWNGWIVDGRTGQCNCWKSGGCNCNISGRKNL